MSSFAVRTLASIAFLVTVAFAGITPTVAQEETPEVTSDEGTTTGEGAFAPGVPAGWQYVRVKSPTGNAWVAVVWGKGESGKGAIWIISSSPRTVAGAQVFDKDGQQLSQSKPIVVRSYFMQRFDAIYEFNDTNMDGIANVVRSNKPIDTSEVLAHEPVYKAASLRTSWTKSNASSREETENGTPVKVWDLTLTATNLPYRRIGQAQNVTQNVSDNTLNRVAFSFHLRGWKQEGDASIPLYRITVDRSTQPPEVDAATSSGTRSFHGNFTHVKVKEDHEIEGWDFDPKNQHPGLVVETHLAFGWAPLSSAPRYIGAKLIERHMKGAGTATFRTDGNTTDTAADGNAETLPDADAAPAATDRVHKIGQQRRISFGGNWDNVANLTWVSSTQVWATSNSTPTTGQVYFQVQGARKFNWDGAGGAKSRGVVLMGGFSYAGGPYYKVRHDPESSVAMAEMNVPDQDGSTLTPKPEVRSGTPGFEVAFTLLATIVLLGAMRPRRK